MVSPAEFPGLRAQFEQILMHRCTVQSMTGGVQEDEGNTPDVPNGAPQTGVPCLYSDVAQVRRADGGTTLVNVPNLMVSATLAINVGDRVTAITDVLGVVTDAGPFRVERVLDRAAGLGAGLLTTWELRGARAV